MYFVFGNGFQYHVFAVGCLVTFKIKISSKSRYISRYHRFLKNPIFIDFSLSGRKYNVTILLGFYSLGTYIPDKIENNILNTRQECVQMGD